MKLLSGFCYDTTFAQRGVLTADLVMDLNKGHRGVREFYDVAGCRIAVQVDDILTLFKGFGCDLCSPSWRVGRWWMGTWTTKREALGAFLHDFARGCLGNPESPWKTIKATDDLFWDALGIMHSNVQRSYHWAVSSFVGRIYHAITFHGPSITVQLMSK